MKIFIAGGGGFVGSSIADRMKKENRIILADISFREKPEHRNISYLEANLQEKGGWQDRVAGHHVIINLAGFPIFNRWNKHVKKAIYGSRISITDNIVDAIKHTDKEKKMSLLSASAIGYYGFHEDEIIDESFTHGSDFLAEVAARWEAAANRGEGFCSRVVNCRFGVILGKGGGAMRSMEPVYKYFLGSRLGNGKQWFSWVHGKDLVDIFIFLIGKKDISGPVNCTSPNPVRNLELNREMLKAFRRPPIVPFTPGFLIKAAMGEMGNVLLKGQRAVPSVLLKNGFTFTFPGLGGALKDIYG